MTAIVTHEHGLSFVELVAGKEPKSTPLALPSRFPASSTPRISISPTSGHAFLWSPGAKVVWEYDTRGQRVGELQSSYSVTAVTAIGNVKGLESVALGTEHVWTCMVPREGKWEMAYSFGVKGRNVNLMAGNADHTLLALTSSDGLTVYKPSETEGARTVKLPGNASTAVIHLVFAPSSPNTLLAATATELFVIEVWPDAPIAILPVYPFSSGSATTILDVAVPKQDDMCAVLSEGGRVALIDLTRPDEPPRMIQSSRKIDKLAFVDSASIAARSASGQLVMIDIHNLERPAETITLDQPIRSIHIVPQIAKPARASLAPSVTSTISTRRILGESRNPPNGQTTPPVPALPLDKGKQAIRTARIIPRSRSEIGVSHQASLPVSASTVNMRGEGGRAVSVRMGLSSGKKPEKAHNSAINATTARSMPAQPSVSTSIPVPNAPAITTSPIPHPRPAVGWTDQPRTATRVVSAPAATPALLQTAAILPRSVSSSSRPRSRGSVAAEQANARAGPSESPVFDDDIAEEDEGADNDTAGGVQEEKPGLTEEEAQDEGEEEEIVYLGWAMRETPPPEPSPQITAGHHPEGSEEVLFLRQEMTRMQMDLLRMNRDIKHDIKMAVQPLVKQLAEQRGMIARQQREIERLRCGM